METIHIMRSRKGILGSLSIIFWLSIFMLLFAYFFYGIDDNGFLIFVCLIVFLSILPLTYLMMKLFKPEMTLTPEGVNFSGNKFYKWENIKGYCILKYSHDTSGDAGTVNNEILAIYFSDGTKKEFNILSLPLDKLPNAIFDLFDQYKIERNKEYNRTTWVL